MTPEQIKAREDYVKLAGPTVGQRGAAPHQVAPVTEPNQVVIDEKQLVSVQQQQPQASIYPQYTYGPGFYPDTRAAGGQTARGLNSYYNFQVIDHYAARMQARATDQKSVEARTLLKRNNTVVIGRGLWLNPAPDYKILGMTREQAAAWAKDVKSRFHLWANSKDSDVTGVNNLYQNMRFAHRQKDRDGEALPRFNYSDDPELLNPLQIGFLDPNQIRGDEFTFTSGPITQEDGLIKDSNGKTTGFKVWINDPQKPGSYKTVDVPAKDKATGMPLMLHMFEPEYAGQTRGIPKITHAVQRLEDTSKYKTAQLHRMQNGALLNFTSFNKQQDPGDFGFSKLEDESAGVNIKSTGIPSTTPTAVGAENVTCTHIPESQVHETGINLFEGRQGDELKATPDLSPGETAKDFTDSNFDYIAPSMGISPEVALMKVNTSFTAAKGALGLQDGESKIERDDIATDLTNPVYEAWMFGEIAAGRIQAPGFNVPVLRAAWLKNNWKSDPPIVLNPQQEATATKINAELGREDLAASAENLNGSDFESNAMKLTEQLKQLPTDPFDMAEDPELIDENETDSTGGNTIDTGADNIIKYRGKNG